MKRLKRGFIAFLVGEFFTLFKKDKKFQQGVVEKNGFEKIKHIVEGLLNFNKELVDDAKEQFDTQALETHLHQGAEWVEKEYDHLLQEVHTLKDKGETVTYDFLAKLQERFEKFTHTALLLKDQLTSFGLEEKITEIKKTLETLAKEAKKK